MYPPLRGSARVWWVAVALMLVAAGAVLWLSTRDRSDRSETEPTSAEAATVPEPPYLAVTVVPSDGDDDGPDSAVSLALPRARPSTIKRGPNNRLLFEDAQHLDRKAVTNKLFPEEILRVRNKDPVGPLTLNRHTLSAVEAAYDPAAVSRFIASDAGKIGIPLDAQRNVIVNIDRVISRGPVTHTLVGKVDRKPLSDVLLVFHDGVVSGSVAFLDENVHYEFGMAGNCDIAIRRLDPATFDAPCGDPGAPPESGDRPADEPAHREEPMAPKTSSAESPADSLAATVAMDTVVGYGIEARIAEGGVAAMEARIIASVDRINRAFTNSQITDIEVSLRATIEDPYYNFPGAISGEMGGLDELGDLNNGSDGILDTVSDLRVQLGADHNAFVIRDVDGSAGIAYRPGRSMIVARTYMSLTRTTFVHEFGHNIGCRHAWGDTTSDSGTTGHNHGWRFHPPGAYRARTIMAYDSSWTRIPYFSNPDVQYAGSSTGAVDGYDATGDSTTDPQLVSGGLIGTAGSGYDGTHPQLGARNAHYIQANAQYLADNADRPEPEIVIEQPTDTELSDGGSVIRFGVPSVGSTDVKTFTIRNVGTADLTGLDVTKDGTHSEEFTVGTLGTTSLAPGASTTFDVTFTSTVTSERTANLHIASNDSDENPFDVVVSGAVRVDLLNEGFESGFGSWTASVGPEFDFNWSRKSGGTGSSDTGPSGASEGNWYIYTEASSPNFPNKTAGLEAGFDSTGISNVLLSLDYHMHGDQMGTLYVDVFDGTWHFDVWSRTGQFHSDESSAWTRTTVDLSAYDGTSGAKIRIRGVTGTGYRSDMAVDELSLVGTPIVYTLTYTAEAGGSISGLAEQTVAHGSDGTPVEAVPDTGYLFVGWSDSTTENPRTDTNVTGHVTVAADFAVDTFDNWASGHGLSGADALPEAVPFGDGVSNLLKYAFNLNGGGLDARSLVPGTGTAGLPVLTIDDSGPAPIMRFEYLRRKTGGLVYTPTQSPDLAPGSWTPMSGTVTVTDINSVWERVVIEHVCQGAGCFVRLRVEVTLP